MIKRILLRLLLALGIVIAVLVLNLVFFNITASRVSEGIPIRHIGPEKSALLVIDIQEGTTGNVSALQATKEQAESLIERVNTIIEDSDARDQEIIYIRTEVVNPLINILNNTMARGSVGAALDHRLLMKPGSMVVKRRNDSFMGTELDRILTENNISRLVLVGLDAAQCVKCTVKAARNRGYKIAVVGDAVISENETSKAQALAEFRDMGVEIVGTD